MPEMPVGKNVAAVTHIIAESPEGFDDAVRVGFTRASKTLRGITGMRVLEQRVAVREGGISTYRVKLEVIFLLEK
jgi:flavin-binding protein dodecin